MHNFIPPINDDSSDDSDDESVEILEVPSIEELATLDDPFYSTVNIVVLQDIGVDNFNMVSANDTIESLETSQENTGELSDDVNESSAAEEARMEENEELVTLEEGNWNFSDDSDEDEEKATLEEVFEAEPAIETKRVQPPDLCVGAEVVDVKFHPSAEIIVVGTLDSEVISYKYSTESTEELKCSEHHDSALRSIAFSIDGNKLFTASKDCSVGILDVQTFEIIRHIKEAHEDSVYSLSEINQNLFASGDDCGIVKIWDIRKKEEIFKFKCGEETVNDILVDDNGRTLVAAVDDGSLTAINITKKKLLVQSEFYESPLTCMALIRNGTRLAVGTGSGNLHVFKWGEFGKHIDTMTDQPEQINCMVAVGDNRIITGCEDKSIRAVNLNPHRFVGIVGTHKDFGVEAISVSCDQNFMASCDQSDTVMFWDLQHVYGVESRAKMKSCKRRDLQNNLKSSRQRNMTEFFSDMAEEVPSDEEYVGPVEKPVNIED